MFWGCLDLALERYLVLAGGVSRRLIDTGCVSGNYSAFARWAGWRVRAIEMDLVAFDATRWQVPDVCEMGVDLLQDEAACYERITRSYVLKHVC